MRCVQFSRRTRLWGSLLLAAALVGFGLAWLALAGSIDALNASGEEAGAWPGRPRLTGRQVPALVQPFSPQRLVSDLAPDPTDRAIPR